MIKDFTNKVWHNLAFEAKENVLTLYLNGKEITDYRDADAAVLDKSDGAQGKTYETEKAAIV